MTWHNPSAAKSLYFSQNVRCYQFFLANLHPILLEFVVTHSLFTMARSQLTWTSKQRFKNCSRRVGHTLVNEEICQEKLSYGCTFLAGGPPVFINLGYMWGDVSHLSILCQPPDINISILIRSRNALKTLL